MRNKKSTTEQLLDPFPHHHLPITMSQSRTSPPRGAQIDSSFVSIINDSQSGKKNRKGSTVLFPLNNSVGRRSPSPHRTGSPQRAGSPTNGFDNIKRNSKGGVLITAEEIQVAFSMLDYEKSGQISLATLKKRLGVLFPEMTAKEFRFLMNNKKDLSLDDLKELLLENDLTNYDPVVDAFKVFDPEGRGMIDEDILRQAFISFGLGELSDEELQVLRKSADINNDGAIGLDDFRHMLDGVFTVKRGLSSLATMSKLVN